MVATLPVTISQFSRDPNLLNTPLWDKQSEILEQFWQGNYSHAVWALGRRSGKTLMSAVTATYAGTIDLLQKLVNPAQFLLDEAHSCIIQL